MLSDCFGQCPRYRSQNMKPMNKIGLFLHLGNARQDSQNALFILRKQQWRQGRCVLLHSLHFSHGITRLDLTLVTYQRPEDDDSA